MTTWGVAASVFAPKCANTATTRTNASQRKPPNTTRTRWPRLSSAISAIDRPRARRDAMRLEKSCTAPMKIDPTRIQITAGSHPQTAHARIGPTMGPTPAMLAKWCPNRTVQCLAGT
jgi:hypothetical protein